MNENRNISLIYCYTFCVNSVFILPVLLLYFQNQLGLTFQQLLMGEALFAAVLIAMEIPSGWLSDVWSRRGTLIVGCIFSIISYGGMMIAQDFWTVMFFMALMGVGVACNSGTVTSILYDSLAVHNKTDLYQKLEGKRHGISLYSIALAAVVGGIAYHVYPKLPLILDLTTKSLGLVCAIMIIEPPRMKRSPEKNPFRDMLITMKYALHGHKEIAGIILVSTILFCTTKMFMWTQQPYMQFVNIPSEYFGYIMASGFLFGGFAGHYGHFIKHKLGNRSMIMMMCGIGAIGAILPALYPSQVSIIFILMMSGIWGFGFPFVQNAINKHADPARRATILSTLGLLISLIFIPASLMIGYLDEAFDIRITLFYLGGQLILLSSTGFYLWSKSRKKTIAKQS